MWGIDIFLTPLGTVGPVVVLKTTSRKCGELPTD
jgi:hypothetical protein